MNFISLRRRTTPEGTPRRFGVLLLVSALAVLSCSGKDPFDPGTRIGEFDVTATLTSTTCGTTPNPWTFRTRLNYEGTTLYWVQGGAPVQGRIDGARADLSYEQTSELRAPDEAKKRPGCYVSRRDVLALSLVDESGQPVTDPTATRSFSGTLTYRFTPAEADTCSDQLLESGGDFEALPCEVHYDLTATRTLS